MNAIDKSYGETLRSLLASLFLIAILFAIAESSMFATHLLQDAVQQTNTYHTSDESVATHLLNGVYGIGIFMCVSLSSAVIHLFLCLGPSQLLFLFVIQWTDRAASFPRIMLILASLPALAAVTWYCYDYATPAEFNFGFNEDATWRPYQHGITPQRYLVTLAAQTAASMFSLARLQLESYKQMGFFSIWAIVAVAAGGLVTLL